MAASNDPIHLAALRALLTISEQNLAKGTSPSVNVWRVPINELRDAIEDRYPGLIARLREVRDGQ